LDSWRNQWRAWSYQVKIRLSRQLQPSDEMSLLTRCNPCFRNGCSDWSGSLRTMASTISNKPSWSKIESELVEISRGVVAFRTSYIEITLWFPCEFLRGWRHPVSRVLQKNESHLVQFPLLLH
jgi:hypothetical protein